MKIMPWLPLDSDGKVGISVQDDHESQRRPVYQIITSLDISLAAV